MENYTIRSASADDADRLTELSFASKRYWRYPEHYFQVWKQELTITKSYIKQHTVYTLRNTTAIIGYYGLVELKEQVAVPGIVLWPGYWLDHMFVDPDHIGKGIGRMLFDHLCSLCKQRRIETVHLLADPKAMKFYEKMGCLYQEDVASTISGRCVALMVKTIKLH